jgi:hypothetical protein
MIHTEGNFMGTRFEDLRASDPFWTHHVWDQGEWGSLFFKERIGG